MTDQTFRSLEEPQDAALLTGESSLIEWYISIRDVPFSNLTEGDLSRACRQRLFLEEIMPFVINRLQLQPMAGEVYDGELLCSLIAVPVEYWQIHKHSATVLYDIAIDAIEEIDDDFKDDIRVIIARLAN